MSEFGWLLAGGTLITGIIATCWQQVKGACINIKSHMITTITVHGSQAEAVSHYLRYNFQRSKFGIRAFGAMSLFVRPLSRRTLVAYEDTSSQSAWYWRNKQVLYVSIGEAKNYDHSSNSNFQERAMHLHFLRGTFDSEALMIEAVEGYNRFRQECSGERRHKIEYMSGTAGKPMGKYGSTSAGDSPFPRMSGDSDKSHLAVRLLKWLPNQIGQVLGATGNAVNSLALSEEIQQAVDATQNWFQNREWYIARGLPWRMGLLLYGETGTGKTSLLRALAEDLDLPVFVFDLSTFFNDELRKEWNRAMTEAPCMMVVEDIDNVFHGRESQVKGEHAGLSFDCLLNCLDGIERCDGLLVGITTNHLAHVDPAISERPGRIDHCVEMTILEESGRRKLARRFLADEPELQAEVVLYGEGETGAEFESRCIQAALAQIHKHQHEAVT